MILSTGVGLTGARSVETYLEKLIEHGASCLCMERGSYFHEPTEEMKSIADRHDFPLILFPEDVRFIDITQYLHSIILNRRHRMLEEFEVVSRNLHDSILTSQGSTNALHILHRSTKADVLFFPVHGKPHFVPSSASLNQRERIADFLKANQTAASGQSPVQWKDGIHHLVCQAVGAMGQIWGYIVLSFPNREPGEFDLLILDRAALSLSQDLLRKRYMDEKKRHTDQLWVDDLIQGRIRNEEQIPLLLGKRGRDSASAEYKVCVIEFSNAGVWEESEIYEEDLTSYGLHYSLYVRSSFESQGFQPYLTAKGSRIMVIVADIHPGHHQKNRFNRAADAIVSFREANMPGLDWNIRIGFGRSFQKWTDAPSSYKDALQVLEVMALVNKKSGYHFEDIGIYRILLNVEDDSVLQAYVDDYLGPLIEYDRVKGGDLLLTLKAYLENNQSKQATSRDLFTVRQTIYHRLGKIKELLGEDYMQPKRRLTIEAALYAYQLLNSRS
ncbi:PucR family transcriptional regulator [Cohnella pontilimi]|nr:helix-turn-helix domain-containing protein [Cohnella pontilimi]